jgi:hypothetical protein
LDTLIQPETESPDYIYEIEDENFEVKPLQEQPVESLKEDNPFLNYELSNFVEEGTQTIVENNERSFVEYEQLSDKESDVQLIDFDLRRAVIYSEILNAPYI